MQPILFPTSDSHVSLPILFLQVSANLKLSEKQEVKKELVSAEEGGPRPLISPQDRDSREGRALRGPGDAEGLPAMEV